MFEYKFKEVIGLLKNSSTVSSKIDYAIFDCVNHYELKFYDKFILGEKITEILICSYIIDPQSLVLGNCSHSYILITEYNKQILSTIAHLVGSKIIDFYDFVPKEVGGYGTRIEESNTDSEGHREGF